MEIAERVESSSVLIFELNGALEMGRDSKKLEWLISERVKSGSRKLVLDLAGVPYIDSAGIGVVVSALSVVARAGGQMRVAGAGNIVQQILTKTGVDGILTTDATVAESICALATVSDGSQESGK